jgi:hypothetical protein
MCRENLIPYPGFHRCTLKVRYGGAHWCAASPDVPGSQNCPAATLRSPLARFEQVPATPPAATVAKESTGFPESLKGKAGNCAIITGFHLETVTVGHLRAAPLRLRQNLPSGRVASGAAAYRLRYAASRLRPRRVTFGATQGPYSFLLFFSLNNRYDSHRLIAVLFSLNQSQFSKFFHRSCSYLSG